MSMLTYHREGDYLLPDLLPPEAPNIGIWGMRRKCYLQQYHDGIYTGMLLSGKLNDHLEEIDRLAEQMFFQFVERLSRQTGITEKLKATNHLEWVRQMNGIRQQAEETVFHDLIYT